VLAATGFALVLQAALFLFRAPLAGDEGHYVLNAVHMAHGRFAAVNTFWPPLFSALGAIPIRLGADPEIVLRFINMASVIALVPLGARLSMAAFGPVSVLPAAWLLAVCPLASNLGASTLSEPIGAVFGAVGLALALPWREGTPTGRASPWRFAAAGAVVALGGFGRVEIWSLLPAVFALALWAPLTRNLRAGLAVILGAALCAGAVEVGARTAGLPHDRLAKIRVNLVLNARELQTASAERERVLYGLGADGERVPVASDVDPSAHTMFAAVRRAIRQVPTVIKDLLRSVRSPFPLLLAALGLLFARRRRGSRGAPWALGFAALAPMLAATLTLPAPRYLLPAMPPLMALAGGGVAYLAGALRGRDAAAGRRPRLWAHAGTWVVVAALLPLPWCLTIPLGRQKAVPRAYHDMGGWLGSHGHREHMLAPLGTYVSYYAGVPEYTFMPVADIDATLGYARRHGIALLVVDSRLRLDVRPGFAQLLDDDPMAPQELGLLRLHVEPINASERVLAYQILPRSPPVPTAAD